MRKHKLLTSLVFLIPLIGFSQPSMYSLDYGVKLGASNYVGDLGGYNTSERPWLLDMKMQETRWSLGAYIRYRLPNSYLSNSPFAIEAQFNWIRITGADTLTTNYNPRKLRRLNFRNDILQLNMLADWIFFENNNLGKRGLHDKAINFYACAGISLFYQDPHAYNPDGAFGLPLWVSLHDLRTEEQNYSKPFHVIQPGIPIGVGVNYTIKTQYRFGWSFTWTKTFTDYLDGVSGYYPTQAQWNSLSPEEKYFSNRIQGYGSTDPAPGGLRGNLGGADSFITTTFNFGYVIRYPKHRRNRSSGGWFGGGRRRGRSKF